MSYRKTSELFAPAGANTITSQDPTEGMQGPDRFVMPIGNRCLKIEHRDGLHPVSLLNLGRAIAFAHERYANFRWVLVIFDQLHDTIVSICTAVKELIPGGHSGRVAVVWVGRLKNFQNYPVHGLPLACECQLFCSAHYGKALRWLKVRGNTGGI